MRLSSCTSACVVKGSIRTFGDQCSGHYDAHRDAWEFLPSVRGTRFKAAIVCHAQRIYLCGGFDKNFELCGHIDRLDEQRRTWERVTEIPTPRHGAAFAIHENKLYVSGGSLDADFNGESWVPQVLTLVERYCFESNTWEAVAPMQEHRVLCAAASLDGRLYVCGGRNISGVLSSVECFDAASNCWVWRAPMSTPRDHAGVAITRLVCDQNLTKDPRDVDTSDLAPDFASVLTD